MNCKVTKVVKSQWIVNLPNCKFTNKLWCSNKCKATIKICKVTKVEKKCHGILLCQ